VKIHLRALFNKLKVNNRTQAAVWYHCVLPKQQILVKTNGHLTTKAKRPSDTQVGKGVSTIAASPVGGGPAGGGGGVVDRRMDKRTSTARRPVNVGRNVGWRSDISKTLGFVRQ
jgi:hypothetical protein